MLGSFQRGGDRAILDRATALLAEAARTPGLRGPALAELDTRLGAVLTTRYVQFGDPADLDAALEALSRARTRDALRGPNRVQAASDLGAALHELSVQSGQRAQLQEAIEVLKAGRREAGSSRGRVFRSLLANLGAVYLGHHEVFGDPGVSGQGDRMPRRDGRRAGPDAAGVAGQPGPGLPGSLPGDGQPSRPGTSPGGPARGRRNRQPRAGHPAIRARQPRRGAAPACPAGPAGGPGRCVG